MDNIRLQEAQYRLEHRHRDGTWAPMAAERSHHDPADHDPERRWGVRTLFRCSKCDEGVLVGPEEEDEQPPPP
jgi:hypothetical protein